MNDSFCTELTFGSCRKQVVERSCPLTLYYPLRALWSTRSPTISAPLRSYGSLCSGAVLSRTYQLQLTPDQSKYILRAATPEEMNDWFVNSRPSRSSDICRLNAFKLSISSGLASGNSMTSEADREKTKTAPELGPELKLLVWVAYTLGYFLR